MAFLCRLVDGTEHIDLFYHADAGWAMLEKGLEPNDPERRELWGGYLEDQLVRQEDGKRVIPLKLQGHWTAVGAKTAPDVLIDAVNALEEMLRHAARFRTDGWGNEVFLEFQLHDSTYAIRYPVCSGSILKSDLMNACASIMTGGHRVTKTLVEVPITIVCEAYWESTATYTLENLIDNPGFWRGAAPGDSWTEDDVGGVLGLVWNTTTAPGLIAGCAVMGRSLQWDIGPDAANPPGIHSDAITVSANTAYYLECRGYHTTGCDRITVSVYDVTNAGFIPGFVLYFDNEDDAWEKVGGTFTTPNAPLPCVSIMIFMARTVADSTAGNKTFYCDAFYLGPGTTAPVGWSSGRNLMNHLDADPDHLNVLCVTEIPGEVEAECKVSLDVTQAVYTIWNAKRTRDDPHNFIWELLAADAYCAVDAVFGLVGAGCLNSTKTADPWAPGGYRIYVDFGVQTMQLRCYWNITANLASYYGKWQLVLLVSKSANTDDVFMRIQAYNPGLSHNEGYDVAIQEAQQATANYWSVLAGWSILSFPIGIHDNNLWGGAGDRWQIRLYASVTGAAAWDNLWIAGAYLIPLDEKPMVAGSVLTGYAAGTDFTIDNLDANKGIFPYDAGTGTHYNNMGYVGSLPTLTPKIENWLYFALGQIFGTGEVLITDPAIVSLQYRPRGIFLRGSNPT